MIEVQPFVADARAAYAAADVLVFPALVDHFPRPLVEAGAMALPAVASDFPGARQVVADSESGFLVPPGDAGALAQAVVYLASAPKSNAVYTAFKSASALVKKTGSPQPPMAILNAPTKLMKGEGYGQGYIYDHDTPEGFSGQQYFPEKIGRQEFYSPLERGFEREIKKRLDYFTRLRSKKAQQDE